MAESLSQGDDGQAVNKFKLRTVATNLFLAWQSRTAPVAKPPGVPPVPGSYPGEKKVSAWQWSNRLSQPIRCGRIDSSTSRNSSDDQVCSSFVGVGSASGAGGSGGQSEVIGTSRYS